MGSLALNRAAVELSLGQTDRAIKDLEAAEKLVGGKPSITSVRAVALSNAGDWKAAAELFEEIISSSEKNALPWWLRYRHATKTQNTNSLSFFLYLSSYLFISLSLSLLPFFPSFPCVFS